MSMEPGLKRTRVGGDTIEPFRFKRLKRIGVVGSESTDSEEERSHVFEIRPFSSLLRIGVGESTVSDVFSVGGYRWKLRFYPNGKETKDVNDEIYASVYVELVSNCTKDLNVWLEFNWVDKYGEKIQPWWRNRKLYTFYRNGQIRGINDFHRRSELEASKYINGDCLKILCSVSVAKKDDVPKTTHAPLPFVSDLKLSYEKLLESKEGSDVSFEVEGEIFNAHKLILSTRSPTFKAQFSSPLKVDNNTRSIKIEDMPASVFKALLGFIYCDAIPDYLDSDSFSTVMTQHLLLAADRYGIHILKSLCETRLCENIAVDNVGSTLAFAEEYCCLELKSRCIEFIGRPENLEDVLQTDGFRNMFGGCYPVICELFKSAIGGRDRKRPLESDANKK